ncbi:hypothetical protein AW120_13880 [Escherichia coli]|nr:hypothetical protein AW120_13880 [Escherichia coli]
MILTLSRYARDATFLKIDEDRPGAPFFKGWIDDSFTMSTNFDELRRISPIKSVPYMPHTCPIDAP